MIAETTVAAPRRRLRLARFGPLVALVVLLALPYCNLTIPGVFETAINKPGTLQLLALCLVFGSLATGYDLLFGRTGMLSFGHALYFAAGVYGTDILVTKAGYPLWEAALLAVLGTAVLALALGAIALRTNGIAFAMVTLAFAQVGAITIGRNPGDVTGGEEGLSMDTAGVPDFLVGVSNTVNLYWLAVLVAVVTVAVVHSIAAAPAGRVLSAIRDDDRRVGVLGLDPYGYRLFAFTVAGALAGLAGVMYALLIGGAIPHVAASDQTLTLLVMVVLGGPGTRWGPLIGGMLFTYLDHRLVAFGHSEAVDSLPSVLGGPLSQPLFVLGTLFILAVYFFPGGLAGLRARLGPLSRVLPSRR
ncbi:branched-chain amino acid ABC transporter permease [Dactylosporangium sp. AC04546]|uniref:branched-chain amino acid ABC transporter permease n=1 Tax=Dactylosporangium sp. AC04546 TaxID=2862460 RepID=UPI001EDC95AA|nr:branched-chain amino acid ABC transporter permease [Dactylosporangium sp. AC04546]WVK81716.1 branched-chain amino acid ABC transporter permease [Dactylosporangium sp. AC04546]